VKLIIAAVAALAMGVGAGCNAPPFDIPSESEFTVPGSGVIGGNPLVPDVAFPADLITSALADSINQSFDTQGYDKGSVKSFKLTKLTLTVTNAEQAGGRELKDLSFLETLAIFIAAGGGGEPIKVAQSDDAAFADGQLTYDMPLTDAELAEALKSSDALDLTADVTTNEQPQFATDVKVESVLSVVVGI
jgi:hypothetical protein